MCQETHLGNSLSHRCEWRDLCKDRDSTGRLNFHGSTSRMFAAFLLDFMCPNKNRGKQCRKRLWKQGPDIQGGFGPLMVYERDYPEHISNKRDAIQMPNWCLLAGDLVVLQAVWTYPQSKHTIVCVFLCLKALGINFEPIK